MTKEEAIEILKHCSAEYNCRNFGHCEKCNQRIAQDMAIDSLRIRKEPVKQGTWVDHRDEGYLECPFCRSATNCDYDDGIELHYCFSCGAQLTIANKIDQG